MSIKYKRLNATMINDDKFFIVIEDVAIQNETIQSPFYYIRYGGMGIGDF